MHTSCWQDHHQKTRCAIIDMNQVGLTRGLNRFNFKGLLMCRHNHNALANMYTPMHSTLFCVWCCGGAQLKTNQCCQLSKKILRVGRFRQMCCWTKIPFIKQYIDLLNMLCIVNTKQQLNPIIESDAGKGNFWSFYQVRQKIVMFAALFHFICAHIAKEQRFL